MSRTRSATLAVSIIDPRSLGHSMIVNRRFLPASARRGQLINSRLRRQEEVPVTTVTGPLMSAIVFFVYRRTSERTSVVLPTCEQRKK